MVFREQDDNEGLSSPAAVGDCALRVLGAKWDCPVIPSLSVISDAKIQQIDSTKLKMTFCKEVLA